MWINVIKFLSLPFGENKMFTFRKTAKVAQSGLPSMEAIRRKRMTLEHRSRCLCREIAVLESRKLELFESGVQQPSENLRRQKAREIARLESQFKGRERLALILEKQIQHYSMLEGQVEFSQELARIKEVSGGVDLRELQNMEQLMIESRMEIERLDQNARVVEEMLQTDGTHDREAEATVASILDAMSMAAGEKGFSDEPTAAIADRVSSRGVANRSS